tara:strand:+ start:1279 stop:1734 length:456 start_codon:yes stop_codon:yes gene_type:complete
MIGKALTGVLVLGMVIIMLTSFLNPLKQATDSARSESFVETRACTSDGSGDNCVIDLTHPHVNTTLEGVTILQQGTSVDYTDNGVLSNDSQSISISGLPQINTLYHFDTTYLKYNDGINGTTNMLLRITPLAVVFLIIGAVVFGVYSYTSD